MARDKCLDPSPHNPPSPHPCLSTHCHNRESSRIGFPTWRHLYLCISRQLVADVLHIVLEADQNAASRSPFISKCRDVLRFFLNIVCIVRFYISTFAKDFWVFFFSPFTGLCVCLWLCVCRSVHNIGCVCISASTVPQHKLGSFRDEVSGFHLHPEGFCFLGGLLACDVPS